MKNNGFLEGPAERSVASKNGISIPDQYLHSFDIFVGSTDETTKDNTEHLPACRVDSVPAHQKQEITTRIIMHLSQLSIQANNIFCLQTNICSATSASVTCLVNACAPSSHRLPFIFRRTSKLDKTTRDLPLTVSSRQPRATDTYIHQIQHKRSLARTLSASMRVIESSHGFNHDRVVFS